MRVLIVNGSPHENGCTRGALEEVASMLINDGIETEWFWIGMEPVAGCIACKHCQSTGRCCKPVSYTHLDVYKRQHLYSIFL